LSAVLRQNAFEKTSPFSSLIPRAYETFRHASLHISLQQVEVSCCSSRPWTVSIFRSFDTLLLSILFSK